MLRYTDGVAVGGAHSLYKHRESDLRRDRKYVDRKSDEVRLGRETCHVQKLRREVSWYFSLIC